MQLGMVGLGRMGANMARRLLRAGHRVVAYDRDPAAAPRPRGGGRGAPPRRSTTLVARPRAGRAPSGSCCRRARRPRRRSRALGERLERGRRRRRRRQLLVQGRRAARAAASPRRESATSTSGRAAACSGLERGYSLMIGGDADAFAPARARASGRSRRGAARSPPTPGREGAAGHGGGGLPPLRPAGRRPLREDGPQRHRVRAHAGVRRGLRHPARRGGDGVPEELRYRIDLAEVAEVWRRGSVVSSWLLDLAAAALARGSRARRVHGARAGLRRGTLDGAGRGRGGGAGDRHLGRALRPLPLAARTTASGRSSSPPCAGSSAATRRPPEPKE